MTNSLTRQEIEKWQGYQLGKPCPKHPNHNIMAGKFGNWCGVKTAFGWCDGGFPTDEWLTNYRKENNDTSK